MRAAAAWRPGSTVLLLHSSASSARQWESLAGALRPGYRVHAVEFHGHGMRTPWDADSPMRLADDAARAFVDFWSGASSWDSLPGQRQGSIAPRMHAVLQHFEALFRESLARWQVAGLGMPMLFLAGSRTVPAARRISELLRLAVPRARHAVLDGMGHMGPITHAPAVNQWIAGFLHAHEPALPVPA